ncbi:MAG: DUF488 domain-containing protein [Candidatus Geothermincolia bacterium]
MIRTERVYLHPTRDDGYRVLVDRLWPRGIRKDEVDLWLREIAPSAELREWYGHDPDKWPEFKKRYHAELAGHPDEVEKVLDLAAKRRCHPPLRVQRGRAQ